VISVMALRFGSRRRDHAQYSLVKTGDSRSITSLSICTSRDTVSSSSALRLGQQANAFAFSAVPFRRTRSAAGSTRARTPEQVGTEQTLPQHCDTMIGTATRIASAHPVLREHGASIEINQLTFDSRFFRRRRKSASSGEVIKIILSLTTIILANSKSCDDQ
jgi:hypothetical protein